MCKNCDKAWEVYEKANAPAWKAYKKAKSKCKDKVK
jgi:hypothetical protein